MAWEKRFGMPASLVDEALEVWERRGVSAMPRNTEAASRNSARALTMHLAQP